MPKKKAEEVVRHFDSLPKSAGTSEERVAATAKYFKIKPLTVKNHLKFWWPRAKFLKEFDGENQDKRRWDRPTKELMETLNKHGTISKTAKALKTTPMTLSKALDRHGIEQEWVVKK